MSCGQAPGYDDVCAGDRLGRLLTRARTDAGGVLHTPPITPAHLHTPDAQMQPTGTDSGEGVQVCRCISGDEHPSPVRDVRR
jgi:hypothetical protein